MARIRTIKPEFFTSEDIVSMTPLARLFYVALWCESDREGRLEWKPNTFKLRYLPGDDCDVPALGEELVERGLILLYEVAGKKYAEIPTFKEHQVINNRESDSIIPARVTDASCTRESGREGRKEGNGKEGKEGDGSPAAPRATRKCPSSFEITPELLAWATEKTPSVDIVKAAEKFRDHTFRNAINDWPGAFRNWLRKDQDDADERKKSPSRGSKQADTIEALTGGLASVNGGNRAITFAG